jgi:hypothetical protein
MFQKQYLIFAGIALAVLVVAYVVYPRPKRRREGFQTTTTVPGAQPIVVMQPPPNLVANPDACGMFANLLATVNSQLQRAEELNYPGQKDLLTTTKQSLEQQMELMKCA